MNRFAYLPFMAKSLLGGAVAGLGATATALADGQIDAAEGVTIALAVVVALGGVWAVPNAQLNLDDAEG